MPTGPTSGTNILSRFITFEGVDGTGKSTQIEILAQSLRASGHAEIVTTREPGGTAWGKRIRDLVLPEAKAGGGDPAPETELALMTASRAQSTAEMIAPALARGAWVLCDRYHDSTEAYQGGGRGMNRLAIRDLHRLLCRDLQPDLTLWFDLPLDLSLARARATAGAGRFEREDTAFFARVSAAYADIAAREPRRVVRVDANGSLAEVAARVLRAIKERL